MSKPVPNEAKKGRGDFEMVVQREGVRAVIEKAAVGKGKKAGQQAGEIKGEGEEEVEEKTFLQK